MHVECVPLYSKMTLWRKWGQSHCSASHPSRWLPLSNKIWLVFPKPLPPVRGALTVCLMGFSRRKWVNAQKKQDLAPSEGPVILAVITLHEGWRVTKPAAVLWERNGSLQYGEALLQWPDSVLPGHQRTGMGCLSLKTVGQILRIPSGPHSGCQCGRVLGWIWERVVRQGERRLLVEPVSG